MEASNSYNTSLSSSNSNEKAVDTTQTEEFEDYLYRFKYGLNFITNMYLNKFGASWVQENFSELKTKLSANQNQLLAKFDPEQKQKITFAQEYLRDEDLSTEEIEKEKNKFDLFIDLKDLLDFIKSSEDNRLGAFEINNIYKELTDNIDEKQKEQIFLNFTTQEQEKINFAAEFCNYRTLEELQELNAKHNEKLKSKLNEETYNKIVNERKALENSIKEEEPKVKENIKQKLEKLGELQNPSEETSDSAGKNSQCFEMLEKLKNELEELQAELSGEDSYISDTDSESE